MALGKALQRLQRVDHLQEVGLGINLLHVFGHILHNEVSHPTAIKLWDIMMPIVTPRFQGKEQCLFGETERTAVGQQKADVGILFAKTARTDEGGNFFNCINHG